MRYYLISDNIDTIVGMRFAGVPGILVHEKKETSDALNAALANKDIGIILITQKLFEMLHDEIYELKLKNSDHLIVEIPDRHGGAGVSDALLRYVREAVGISV